MNIASIDIGTNTVILLIGKINGNKFITLHNEFRIPRVGKGLKSGGLIKEEKIIELMNVLTDYKVIIGKYNCTKIFAIATNAFRIASNSKEIIDLVKNQTGINIEIISGNEEAEYSFLGAVSEDKNKDHYNLVIDIGGGSTELIFGKPGNIQYKNSFNTGVVVGTERFFLHSPPLFSECNNFTDYLSEIFKEINIIRPFKTIAIAGTPTTLACINKGLTDYDEDLVEGSILKAVDVRKLKDELSYLSAQQIEEKYKSVVTGREDVLFAGTIILFQLMEQLNIPEVVVSTKGIRYGVIYKNIININLTTGN